MVQIFDEVDVCVIGAGAGGATIARQLTEAKIQTVILEAGRKFNLDTDFSDLSFDMIGVKFLWPLKRKAYPFMLDVDNNYNPTGIPNKYGVLFSAWGVGGTTLIYYGNHPRAYYYSLDQWDDLAALPSGANGWRNELVPYYEYLERILPVTNAPMGYGPFDTHNAIPIVGAANFKGLKSTDPDYDPNFTSIPEFDPAQYDPAFVPYGEFDPGGYRGQPNNMTNNCWHCGNCMTGCHKPQQAQLKDKVKRATNVSMIPQAETIGLEVSDRSFVVAVLHPDNTTDYYPNLVIYGTYSLDEQGLPNTHDGLVQIDSICIQPATVVVFSGSTVETPRLWLQSNALLNDPALQPVLNNLLFQIAANFGGLDPNDPNNYSAIMNIVSTIAPIYIKASNSGAYTLPPNDNVGRYFMTHAENFIVATYNKPVQMWIGQNGQSRVDIPPLGFILSVGIHPALLANIAFAKDARFDSNGDPIPDPEFAGDYDHPIPKFGVGAKENLLKKYKYMKIVGALSDDEPVDTNRVFLDPDINNKETFYVEEFDQNISVPVPAIQYAPSTLATEKRRKMTKICMEVLNNVDPPATELTLQNLFNMNMEQELIVHSMGTMSMGKVVNTDCEAIGAPGIFIADASVLPNSLGGPNPANTIEAMALRTAESIGKKFLTSLEWKKWKTKVGTGHFL